MTADDSSKAGDDKKNRKSFAQRTDRGGQAGTPHFAAPNMQQLAITAEKTRKLLNNLNLTKLVDPDGIHVVLINTLDDIVSESICILFQAPSDREKYQGTGS